MLAGSLGCSDPLPLAVAGASTSKGGSASAVKSARTSGTVKNGVVFCAVCGAVAFSPSAAGIGLSVYSLGTNSALAKISTLSGHIPVDAKPETMLLGVIADKYACFTKAGMS